MISARFQSEAVGRLSIGIVATVLIIASLAKIQGFNDFLLSVARMHAPGPAGGLWIAYVIPPVELLVGCLIVSPLTRRFALHIAFVLFCLFTVYLIVRRMNPALPSCNCFGNLRLAADERTESTISILRNLVLIVLTALGLSRTSAALADGADAAAPRSRKNTAHPAAVAAQFRPGFTLIELLVVFGIIGLLVALTFPAFSGIRKHALDIRCKANLQQISGMANSWAADHKGFLPLDGSVEVSAPASGLGVLPQALTDGARRHYSYVADPGTAPTSTAPPTLETPASFVVALAGSVSPNIDLQEPTGQWNQLESKFPALRIFRCPAAANPRAGSLASSDFDGGPALQLVINREHFYSPWWINTDYATNGSLMGYHYDRAYDAIRSRGRVAAARGSSNVVLCGDSGGWQMSWIPRLSQQHKTVTLADVLTRDRSISRDTLQCTPLDIKRHNNASMNIAFLDGHVESVRITPAALLRCRLTVGLD